MCLPKLYIRFFKFACIVIYIILLQVGLVAMETCIAKGMELTQQLLALPCSTMAWVVAHATKSNVQMIHSGVSLAPL